MKSWLLLEIDENSGFLDCIDIVTGAFEEGHPMIAKLEAAQR